MELNKGSRTANAAKNAISSLLNKFVILGLTFISRRLFIQYIGVEYLGINGLFGNILTLLSMADLGLGTAMNVSLYKPIAQNDTKKLSALLYYYSKIYIYIACAVTIIGLSLIPFLKYLVNMEQDIPHLYLYYVIFVLQSSLSYLFIYKSAILYADQKTYIINKIDIYINLLKVIIQMLAIYFLHSFLAFILISIIFVLIRNIVVAHKANKEYPFIREHNSLSVEEKKGIFSNVFSIFLYKIAWSLLNGTDNILMSAMIGTVFVGFYSNYLTITTNIETFIALLFNSLTAGIGNLIATSTAKHCYSTFKTMQLISFWLCGIVSVCLFYLMQDFIVLWVGEKLLLDNLTLIAIVVNVFFSTCMRPVWTFREGTGMYHQIRYIMIVTAIVNLVLSVILGKLLGISGILFATSISKISTYFWYEPRILFKKHFEKPVHSYYLMHLKNVFTMCLCLLICYYPMKMIAATSFIYWLLKAIICFVIVNVVYFILNNKTDEFSSIKQKISNVFSYR